MACSRGRRWLAFASRTLLAAILAAGCSRTPETGGRAAYNVLLVTLDTTRADYLGCYGHAPETSPNFDALASDGVRFDMAISTSATTPPSHASILTGLNPPQHEVRVIYAQDGYCLPDFVPTLASILQDEGWQTAAFLSSFPVSEFYGFDRGFDTFDSGLKIPASESIVKGSNGIYKWPLRVNQRRSDETTYRAIAWLRAAERPFCTWIHYWDPHDDVILPPQEVVSRFSRPGASRFDRRRAIYSSEVFYIDSQFGRLIRFLKDQGEYEKTIIVVVSDHGEGLGDHGWQFHRILYQEQIRVPLIARIPGWPAGRVLSDLVRTIDIAPTILDVLGVQAPAPMEGRSLTPLVEGKPETPRIAYADAINLFDLNAALLKNRPDDALLHCAMQGKWKLIYRPREPRKSELYDLSSDPRETTNLYLRESDQAERLKAKLARFNGFVTKPFGTNLDPDVLERLESLGYIR